MDRRMRLLEREWAAGDPSARARLKAHILRTLPATVGEFLVLDAQRDTGLIKQARVTGVWKVRAVRIAQRSARFMLRRVENGELAPDDFAGHQPRNTIWLGADRVVACLVRVGEPELAVECDHCAARMGEPCRRPSGRLHGAPHVARREALLALLAPPEAAQEPQLPPVDLDAARALRAAVAARMGLEGLTRTRLHPEEGGPPPLEEEPSPDPQVPGEEAA